MRKSFESKYDFKFLRFFSIESGQSGERFSRDVLANKLGVLDDERTAKIPLLYYVISAFQNQEQD